MLDGYPSAKKRLVKKNPKKQSQIAKEWDASLMATGFIPRWHIVMVTGCNLRCTYCATEHGRFGQAKEGVMSLKTANVLAERIVQCVAPSEASVVLEFGGGETFLHFDRFIKIHDLIVRACRTKGVQVSFHVTTNGVLLNEDRLQKLAKRRINLSFSIDGPEAVHDVNRRSALDQSTFKTAFGNWQRYRLLTQTTQSSHLSSVHSVFTMNSGTLQDICNYWAGQGIPLAEIAPANVSRFSTSAQRKEAKCVLRQFMKGLRETAMEQAETCSAMTFLSDYRGPQSIFMGWSRLLQGREKHFCTPAQGILAVGHGGDIYPCEAYIGMPQWRLGDLLNGIDVGKVSEFSESYAQARAHCEGCQHRQVCDKPCFAIVATDTPLQNVKQRCKMAKQDARIIEASFKKLMRSKGRGKRE